MKCEKALLQFHLNRNIKINIFIEYHISYLIYSFDNTEFPAGRPRMGNTYQKFPVLQVQHSGLGVLLHRTISHMLYYLQSFGFIFSMKLYDQTDCNDFYSFLKQ